jgi:ubiquinone/menaquinone biosynthesis C-methylase UbiE
MTSAESCYLEQTRKDGWRNYLREMDEQGYSTGSIGLFHKIMIPYLLRELAVGGDEIVVDVGAAQGHLAISAKVAGYKHLVAVDVDSYNFQLFGRRYEIRCELCDVSKERLPFGNQEVGAVFCFHLIEHLHSVELFLAEAYRVLRPGGALAIVTPDWRKQYKSFWRDPTHVHPYDKQSIARVLRMHSFCKIVISSWGPRYGSGRLKAYRWIPKLGMIGADLLAVAFK